MSCQSNLQSTDCMCGEFNDPPESPLYQCAPYRVKRTCEAPEIPILSVVSYDPDANPPFQVS